MGQPDGKGASVGALRSKAVYPLAQAGAQIQLLADALGVAPGDIQIPGVYESGSRSSTWYTPAANTTGISWNIGPAKDFDTLFIPIRPSDATDLPQAARLQVRETDINGAILADVVVPLPFGMGDNKGVGADVRFDLPFIGNGAGANLYVVLMTDGDIELQTVTEIAAEQSFVSTGLSTTAGTLTTLPVTVRGTTVYWVRACLLGLNNALADSLSGSNVPSFPYQAVVNKSGVPANSDTFSGWGTNITFASAVRFNVIQLGIMPLNMTYPVSQVRVIIRATDVNGAVLHNRLVTGVQLRAGGNVVEARFYSDISLAAGTYHVSFHTDGMVGVFGRLSTGAGTYYWTNRATATASCVAANGTSFATQLTPWYRFILRGDSATPVVMPEAIRRAAVQRGGDLIVNLPPKLYAVVGEQFHLELSSVVFSDLPWGAYTVDIECTRSGPTQIGEQRERYYRLTPVAGDVGSHTFTLRVRRGQDVIHTATSTLVVSAATGGPTREILQIGDSNSHIAAAKASRGHSLAEAMRLIAKFGGGLTPVGDVSGTQDDAGTDGLGTSATERTLKNAARSGWTVEDFFSNASSPFGAGTFSVTGYRTTYSINLASDYVAWELGTNEAAAIAQQSGVLAGTKRIETAVHERFVRMQAALDFMIDAWQATDSGVKMLIHLPRPSSTQDAFGASYGTGIKKRIFDRAWALICNMLIAAYGYRESEGIYVVASGLMVDARNNLVNASASNVNYYNDTDETLSNNAVHLAASAGYQVGAALAFAVQAIG